MASPPFTCADQWWYALRCLKAPTSHSIPQLDPSHALTSCSRSAAIQQQIRPHSHQAGALALAYWRFAVRGTSLPGVCSIHCERAATNGDSLTTAEFQQTDVHLPFACEQNVKARNTTSTMFKCYPHRQHDLYCRSDMPARRNSTAAQVVCCAAENAATMVPASAIAAAVLTGTRYNVCCGEGAITIVRVVCHTLNLAVSADSADLEAIAP